MHIIIANVHRDFGGEWNLSCWVKDKRIMHDLCCNYIIWIHFHAHLAVGHKTHRRNPLNALSSVLQQQFHACKWIKCTVIEQGERSQSAGGYFLFISVNDQGITALWVITHLVEAVNQAFGPVLWTLEAVALRKTCVRQHTARVSAASVRVDTAGGEREKAIAGFPTVARHVFVWEGPGSRRRRAKRLHSWCIKGSRAITFADYTIWESIREDTSGKSLLGYGCL